MLKKEISQICDQFLKEELGNRLSQFSMIALKGMLIKAVEKYEGKVDPGKGGQA